MTEASIDIIDNSAVISVCGHSGYDKYGRDLVCAGVSTVTQGFLQTLKYYESQHACKILTIDDDEGLMFTSFEMHEIEPIMAIISMLAMTLQMLALTYPEYITFNYDRG